MLGISKNGRYFLKDGKFYPYIADTAWTMLQRLNRDEIIYYLDKRLSQGFSAVQVAAISELDGIRTQNREGNLPFDNENVSAPNCEYFSLLVFLAKECEKRDMVLTLLPTWGDKFNKKWGIGPEIFTPENAYGYGRFLANALIGFENIIWMLGGDRPIETEYHRAIIDKMAQGLKSGEGTHRLITYHPTGEKSSYDYLPDTDYIDFHCIQSSHAFKGFCSEKMILKTLKADKKPCIDGECAYEDIPLELNAEWDYRFCAYDIRKRIYKNLLSGAAGAVYGHQSVWCFKDKADGEYPYSWRDALDRPMANQMKYIRTLLSLFDIEKSRPDRRFIGAVAAVSGNSTAAYIEDGKPVFLSIRKEIKSAEHIWLNPSNGEIIKEKKDIKPKTVFYNPFKEDALLIIR